MQTVLVMQRQPALGRNRQPHPEERSTEAKKSKKARRNNMTRGMNRYSWDGTTDNLAESNASRAGLKEIPQFFSIDLMHFCQDCSFSDFCSSSHSSLHSSLNYQSNRKLCRTFTQVGNAESALLAILSFSFPAKRKKMLPRFGLINCEKICRGWRSETTCSVTALGDQLGMGECWKCSRVVGVCEWQAIYGVVNRLTQIFDQFYGVFSFMTAAESFWFDGPCWERQLFIFLWKYSLCRHQWNQSLGSTTPFGAFVVLQAGACSAHSRKCHSLWSKKQKINGGKRLLPWQ